MVLVQCKTTAREIFNVEIDPSGTVKELQEKIETMKDKKINKLICVGKVLKGDDTLSNIDFTKDGNFVVVMFQIAKKPVQETVKNAEPVKDTKDSVPESVPGPVQGSQSGSLFEPVGQPSQAPNLFAQPTPDSQMQELKKNPLFAHLPQLYQELISNLNADTMRKTMEQSPEIKALFESKPEDAKKLLENPMFLQGFFTLGSMLSCRNPLMGGMGGMPGMPGMDGIMQDQSDLGVDNSPMGQVSIQLTESEASDVKELIELVKGSEIAQGEIVQMYMACDKSKDATANMLLNQVYGME